MARPGDSTPIRSQLPSQLLLRPISSKFFFHIFACCGAPVLTLTQSHYSTPIFPLNYPLSTFPLLTNSLHQSFHVFALNGPPVLAFLHKTAHHWRDHIFQYQFSPSTFLSSSPFPTISLHLSSRFLIQQSTIGATKCFPFPRFSLHLCSRPRRDRSISGATALFNTNSLSNFPS